MKPYEDLFELGIDKCPECKCAVSDDWLYIPFTCCTIIECPQCKNQIDIADLLKEFSKGKIK